MKKTLFLSVLLAAVGMAVVLDPASVMAAEDLTKISSGMSNVARSFAPMLRLVFVMGGFFLVGIGLWQLYQKSQQPGQPKGGAIIAIFVGVMMIAAPQIAKLVGGSLGTNIEQASGIIESDSSR